MTDVNIKKITSDMIELEVRDFTHTPYNKAAHQLEGAFCSLKVMDYDGSGPNPDSWTDIHLSEAYTIEGGKRPVRREISMVLNSDQRKALIAALLREEGVQV